MSYDHSSGDLLGRNSGSIRCPECGAHLRELSYTAGACTVLVCGPCGYTFRLEAHVPSRASSGPRNDGSETHDLREEDGEGSQRIIRLPILEVGPSIGSDSPRSVEIELHFRVL
jgi:hypothetical protein